MKSLTKEMEQFIEHEVQLRVHDQKFISIEKSIDRLDDSIKHLDDRLNDSIKHIDNKIDTGLKHLDSKLNWVLGIFISVGLIGCMIPVALHFMKVA